jgi:sugar phosphate isomerase/epimerase
VSFIELHGNHYGSDLGYRPAETLKVLADAGVRVAGICGMFSPDNDLSSPRGVVRQRALDYIRRTLDFARQVKAGYMLVVPGAVGRPGKLDDQEFHRSVETLRLVADEFARANVRAAIEPIRAAEVSFCHTFDDAEAYIQAVNHAGVRHINGDLYHMLSQESHIAQRLWQAGEKLINLHMADTNRRALGEGMLDLDTILMALYLIRYNRPGCYCTPEPLGPGGDPYPAMFGRTEPALLDALVNTTSRTFREREEAVRAMQ